MTFNEKLDIVARHYADTEVDSHKIMNLFRQAYINGFKKGAVKARTEQHIAIHDSWRIANNIMQCDHCRSEFNLATWKYCPVCGTCMDGSYNI